MNKSLDDIFDEKARDYDHMAVDRVSNNPDYWLGFAGAYREISVFLNRLQDLGYIEVKENKEIEQDTLISLLGKPYKTTLN